MDSTESEPATELRRTDVGLRRHVSGVPEWRRYTRLPFQHGYWSSAATPSSTVAVITPTPTERPTTAETN